MICRVSFGAVLVSVAACVLAAESATSSAATESLVSSLSLSGVNSRLEAVAPDLCS